MRTFVTALALLVAACNHVEVAVPGVLDLRSDGAALAVDKRPVAGAREGMDAMLHGDGVTGAGAISVEGRAWWLASLVRVSDGDVDEGLRAALGTGALRGVSVQEETGALEALAYFCGLPIPCVDLFVVALMPTRTVSASGTRVTTSLGPTAPPVDAPVTP